VKINAAKQPPQSLARQQDQVIQSACYSAAYPGQNRLWVRRIDDPYQGVTQNGGPAPFEQCCEDVQLTRFCDRDDTSGERASGERFVHSNCSAPGTGISIADLYFFQSSAQAFTLDSSNSPRALLL
jgi:hypothetical protein